MKALFTFFIAVSAFAAGPKPDEQRVRDLLERIASGDASRAVMFQLVEQLDRDGWTNLYLLYRATRVSLAIANGKMNVVTEEVSKYILESFDLKQADIDHADHNKHIEINARAFAAGSFGNLRGKHGFAQSLALALDSEAARERTLVYRILIEKVSGPDPLNAIYPTPNGSRYIYEWKEWARQKGTSVEKLVSFAHLSAKYDLDPEAKAAATRFVENLQQAGPLSSPFEDKALDAVRLHLQEKFAANTILTQKYISDIVLARQWPVASLQHSRARLTAIINCGEVIQRMVKEVPGFLNLAQLTDLRHLHN